MMKDEICRSAHIEAVGGDDLTLKVCFYYPNDPTADVFGEGDRIELLIRGDEEISIPGRIVGKVGYFTVSGEVTQNLAQAQRAFITYSVRIYWADGERSTPIGGAPLIMKE